MKQKVPFSEISRPFSKAKIYQLQQTIFFAMKSGIYSGFNIG